MSSHSCVCWSFECEETFLKRLTGATGGGAGCVAGAGPDVAAPGVRAHKGVGGHLVGMLLLIENVIPYEVLANGVLVRGNNCMGGAISVSVSR